MTPEAIRWQPEVSYRTPLVLWTTALATITAATTIKILRPSLETWIIPVIIGSAWVMTQFAVAARLYITDYFRALSPQERVLYYLFPIGIFMLPSVMSQRWSPVTGLLVLQVPALLTLVNSGAYAR